MSLVVQKYGGTSLSTPSRIRDIAARLARLHAAGGRLIVVVSAMGGTTSSLQSLANEVCAAPDPRELDMLLTAGERISMSLMSMALKSLDIGSISLTGSQSGIITDTNHTRAQIVDVRGDRILEAIESGRIAIVAGFQGVSPDREVTTLGPGGSDVTAVAIATRFEADICEIYTDVDGVYTANPGRVARARRITALDHRSMIRYAELGAGVLQPRAARRAADDRVPLKILSSFIPGAGTTIRDDATLPDVIGIGCVHHVRRVDTALADREAFVTSCEQHGVPVLALEGSGAVWMRDGEYRAMTPPLTTGAIADAQGTMIAVLTRPDVDVHDTCEALIDASLRASPALHREPGVVAALVRPETADAVIATLHETLIEAAPVTGSS